MAKIEIQTEINAPIEAIYQASQDYAVRYEWDPFPERIELLHGATTIAKGVEVLVIAKSGLKMVVEFIQVQPPTTAAIKMVSGPFFLASFSGSWVFKETSTGHTTAKFIYSITPKPWAKLLLIGYFANVYFSKAAQARLNGLKRYCENINVD